MAPLPSSATATATAALLLCLLATAVSPAAAAAAAELKAGDLFHICHRSDPKLGDCVKQSLEKLLPLLLKGIPELKIPPFEPLTISKISIKQGQGPVSLDSTFENQKVHGTKNMKFTSASANIDENTIQFKFATPYLYFEGNYIMDGRILLVPIKGQGFGRSNYTGLLGTATLRAHRVMRGGREYLELDETKFDMQIKSARFQLDNLFNGDKLLSETLSRLLESNWALVFAELKPVVDETIGTVLGESARSIFKRFPLDELFPQ